jgi:hypothetical protein
MSNNNKQLMYAISNSLSKPEAISFAKSINTEDKYYITCVHRNPKARHLEKRERFVVVRDLQKSEIVPNDYTFVYG